MSLFICENARSEDRALFLRKINELLKGLQSGDYPIWVDGFNDVIARGHTADEDDNPYYKSLEPDEYSEYESGAIAAECFKAFLKKQGYEINP